MSKTAKSTKYHELHSQIMAVVAGETSRTARFASAACLLAQAFSPRFYWTGFYQVDPHKPGELVVGPYQGTLGCLRIPFGKGVCGACAATGKTQLVADVHAFAGHIACDSATAAEIVVPVLDADGVLVAVLDIDSTDKNAFDAEDQQGLEKICQDLLLV
ncbi:GAF domain-containing proteins [hydrothermal vent metagenome]|uniref:GAF domain-containing proteins n=1 Tax=hydrothermal vent metagenome TaxID=652676 RepID=A0A3B0RFZ8_9ZZZZ